MRVNKKIFLNLSIILFILSASLLVIVGMNMKDNEGGTSEDNLSDSVLVSLDHYAYIDTDNNLSILDKTTREIIVVDTGVDSFTLSKSDIIYTKKEEFTNLLKYSLPNNKISLIVENYENDFISNDDFVIFVKDNSLNKYNLETEEISSIHKVYTEDLVFNWVDSENIIFSHMKGNLPTTYKYNFQTMQETELFNNATNVMIAGEYIYGLDENLNVFRQDKFGNNEVVNDLPVLKFYINDNYFVYMDEEGILKYLDEKQRYKEISVGVNDFIVQGNYIYYTSLASDNQLFRIPLGTGAKEVIIKNLNSEMKFLEFN